jgi:tetratricopeptide (TPR) repeat protein
MKKWISIIPATTAVIILLTVPLVSCSTSQKSVLRPLPPKVEQRIRRYPDPEINEVVASAWNSYSNGRYEQSALDFERLIKKGYDHYDILFGAGCANMKYYDFKKALSILSKCISERSDHFEALFFRAEIYRQMMDYTKARADLEMLLTIEPSSPLICGLYQSDVADRTALSRRKDEARAILKTM